MTQGRKPKPTALKVIEGNPGKRPLNENEPQMPRGAVCPEWLPQYAKEEWALVAPGLEVNGLLTVVDTAAFAAYCVAVAAFREATEEIAVHGTTEPTKDGGITTSPFVHQRNNASRLMLSFESEFGLTPVARSRISVPQKETDDLEELVSGDPN